MAGRSAGSIHYTRASRRAGSVATYHQMWKAPDHLLLVKETGWAEEYKRFYYTDIQAVVVKQTAAYLIWAIILPILYLFAAGIGQSVDADTLFYIIAGVLFLVIWSLHLIQGPTCKCWIQTGINKEKLLMFRRVRQVRKFWKMISPILMAAQGEFSLEEMEREGTFKEAKNTPVIPPDVAPVLDVESGAE